MNVLKAVTIPVTLMGLAALGIAAAPSVYGTFDQAGTPALAQGGQSSGSARRGRELTVLAGRGGELGVRIADAKTAGIEIEDVEPDSAASRAGLKAGDIITSFDGERVRSARQFARLVRETAPGRTVKATITRNDRQQDVEITLTEGRDSAAIFDGDRLHERLTDRFGDLGRLRDLPFDFNFDFDFPAFNTSGRLGITVTGLTDQLARYFGTNDGLLVTSVSDGSAAAQAGVKAGDVITSINGSPARSRSDLLRSMREGGEGELMLGIVRDRKEMSVRVKIEPRRPPRGARPV